MSERLSPFVARDRDLLSLSPAETDLRLGQVRKALTDAGLSCLLAYADSWRTSNVSTFTDFRPLDGVGEYAQALLLIPIRADPTLYVASGARDWADDVFPYPVRRLSDLIDDLPQWTSPGTIGLAGSNLIPAGLLETLRRHLTATQLQPTSLLTTIKAVKTPRQLALLRHATALNDHGLEAVRLSIATGRPHTERDVARIAETAMLNAGADGVGYASMVQSGPRSSWNLALPTDRVIRPGEMVLTDIGARYRGMTADDGRGFTTGPITGVQHDITDASASAVETGMAMVRPGLSATELNAVIQQVLVDRGYADHSGEARGHGTGHGTGIDPEEEQPWIEPGNSIELAPDMVFTLKATITVPGSGGVRTERIVRVTEAGCEAFDQFPLRNHW